MKTYHKTYTRDNGLIMQASWAYAFDKGFEKIFGIKNPFLPSSIYYINNGMVEIWDNDESFKWFFNVLLEKNMKDSKFYEKSIKEFYKILKEVEEIKKKGSLNSIEELKEFVKILFIGSSYFIIFYHSAMDIRTPKLIKEKALKTREADNFFSDCDKIIRNTLSKLYPYLKGNELVITLEDLDDIPSDKVIQERMNNFLYIPGIYSKVIELNNFLENNKEYKFIIEKTNIEKDVIKGSIAYKGKVQGKVRILKRKMQVGELVKGEILVSPMTTPDFISDIKYAGAIITDEGGITCHASIISRELKKPAIIGTKIATKVLHDGDLVEVDADKGVVKILKRNI